MSSRARDGERGIALLLVILVVTLVAVVVVEFTYSTEVDAHVTRNALNATQAHYLARSGAALGQVALRVDAEQKALSGAPAVETLTDTWARPFPPLAIDGGFGFASFTISDETSKFNLNALAVPGGGNPTLLEMRKQLLQAILGSVGADENLAFALVDWVDFDDMSDRESGAERQYYQRRDPPYEPRNGLLLGFDELAMVRGFETLTRTQWTALRRIVTVLPTTDLRINLNTAPGELLNAIGSSVNAAGLGDTIVRARETRSVMSIAEMAQLPGMSALPPLVRAAFDVRSTYFRIHAVGGAGDARRGVAVTVERPRGGTRLRVVDWSEEAASIALTSSGSSAGIPGSSLP
ncbi:MAG: type II secretion system minor pseudopilin GspK [Candidatus Binatia bacterium]